MVCNRMSFVKARRAAGFTLAEYMMAMSIGMLALAAAVVLWGYASQTCATLLNYVDLSIASKNVLDRMSLEIRNARSVKLFSSSQLVLFSTNGTTISYVYHPVGQT